LGTLKKAKDVEWKRHVDRNAFVKWKRGRYTIDATRATVLAFPTLIEIVAPQTAAVESMTMTAHLNKPLHGLVLKLTPQVLGYLRAVVTEQLETGGCSTITHVRTSMAIVDRVDTGVPNLFWSYGKGKYRAKHNPPEEDGGIKPRPKEFLTKCKMRAVAFIETGDRGISSDDEDSPSPDPSEAEDEDEAEDDRSTA